EVLDDVDAAMAALRSTWHGEASDQQAQAQQQWDEGAEQMKAALEQLKTIAEAARKNYSDAVNKNGQMWG
ncbi:MAG: WXG100 family type VII secretion target, partial [Mycolicibacterium sp.]|nr:WXG100 family type VII secretion target [Mycolicibacterium sp.]